MRREAIERLGPGDEERLDAFLAGHSDSSMFLRSNWRRAGMADRGGRLEGTYVARLDGGAIAAVAAHYGNGMIALQAPAGGAGMLAVEVARATGRPIEGLVGPRAQVVEAREALGMAGRATALDTREDLFALELDALVVSDALREGRVVCRRAGHEDREIAGDWRVAYAIEAVGSQPAPRVDEEARGSIAQAIERRELWLLCVPDGAPLAMSALNASLPDRVQIGGVYTPPALRGRGHGGDVVAGQLLELRAEGMRRAVLFTDEENHAAVRAYQRIGFVRVGDYGLVLFAG
jgi:RimJ/RimL family protein N-acetyltransferase